MSSKKFVGKMFVAAALSLLTFAGVSQAYTKEDVTAAKGDVTILKKIIDDTASSMEVRAFAIGKLPRAQVVTYLDSDVLKAVPGTRAYAFSLATQYYDLPLSRYGEAIAATVAHPHLAFSTQRAYVVKLQKEKQFDKALSESKRLLGMAPPTSKAMQDVISLIASAIKSETFARTSDVSESVAAMNQFLTDIKDGTATHPWFALAYPQPLTAVVAPEANADPLVAIYALLHGGKFDAARAKAEAMFAAAATAGETELAVRLIAQAINGKAQRPDAANEFLSQFEG